MNAKKNTRMSDAPAAAEQQTTTATENSESGGNAQQLPETTAAPAAEQEAELIDEADASDETNSDAATELHVDDPERQAETSAAAKPAPIDGPVPLLGKTQDDASATAHAAGTAAPAKPAEPAGQGAEPIGLPPGFLPWDHGVTRELVYEAAIAAHQANKAYCESIGDTSQVDWDVAPGWQCQSAINGVCFAIANNFPSPEAMHINWMKEKVAAGWHWGVEKNPEAKTHPCIMPYANLPEDQRRKDDIFRETITKVVGRVATDGNFKDADERAEKRPPTQEAIAMASMLECAAAMCGMLSEEVGFIPPEITPDVAICLADYFRNEPGAPAAGGLMQVRLKLKVVLLPYEDPRRVELTLDLFRLALTRMEKFIAEDAKAEADRQQAAQPQKLPKPAEDDATFARDDERFDKSDIGKALDQRAQ